MTLKQRAQQHGSASSALAGGSASRQRQQQGEEQPKGTSGQPINLFRGLPVYGIVDGQIVQVLGLTDLPGFSLAWICVDPDSGDNAPVPYNEAKVFPTLTKGAIQTMIDAQNGTTR